MWYGLRRICGLLLTVALLWPAPAAAAPAVTAVRAGEHPASTRFVVEISAKVNYRLFTLPAPYRVVIDFPELEWRLKTGRAGTGGVISGLRYGLFRPGTSRIVLDLKAPVRVKNIFVLEPSEGRPYRLVLDLVRVQPGQFRAEQKGTLRRVALTAPTTPPLRDARKKRATEKRVIALDPGHGGVDPGATGVTGIYEKRITLAMARDLKRRLEKDGRYKVVLTRGRDVFVRLRERVRRARAAGADLFVSLHADTIANRRVRGLSVYTLSEKASDTEAAALAAKENKSDLIAGMDLNAENPEVVNILIDLAQRETMNLSAKFATMLISELRNRVKLLHKSHRFAGFAVLKAPDVPSVLLEMGYLSNRKDERLLRQEAYRAKLATAISRAADRYFKWKEILKRS
jgi:N-acetylmuramoyl-L-alanine amidase